MSEHEFVEQNSRDWIRLSQLLDLSNADANELNELFVKVSGDLAYAQTYFPRRRVRIYLNDLVIRVFDKLHTRKKAPIFSSLSMFYNETLPRLIAKHQYAFIASFVIFLVAFIIGCFSTLQDHDFPRVILGDGYVEMTKANIKKGDAFNVYKREDSSLMSLGIAFNNIRVAFLAFVFGLLTSVGTAYILVYNGIMVGSFMTFFYNEGLARDAVLTIWIHGTIEISIIIIAGAAGIIMGHSLIKPGTLSRMDSLIRGAKAGMTVLVSTIPLFILAALLEGFVTRLTSMPDILKTAIIVGSALLILAHYFYKPMMYRQKNPGLINIDLTDDFHSVYKMSSDNNSSVKSALIHVRKIFGEYIGYVFIPVIVLSMLFYYFAAFNMVESKGDSSFLGINQALLMSDTFDILTVLLLVLVVFYFFVFVLTHRLYNSFNIKSAIKTIGQYFLGLIVATAIVVAPSYWLGWWAVPVFFIIPLTIAPLIVESLLPESSNLSVMGDVISKHYKMWNKVIGVNLGIMALIYIVVSVIKLTVVGIVSELMEASQFIADKELNIFFYNSMTSVVLIVLLLPIAHYMAKYRWQKVLNEDTSEDLEAQIDSFVTKKDLV